MLAALAAVLMLRWEVAPGNAALYFYALLSLCLLVGLSGAKSIRRELPLAAHAIDIAFVTIVAISAPDLRVSVFILLLFPLLAAGYRWGFRGVMFTAASVSLLLANVLVFQHQGLRTMLGVRANGEQFDPEGLAQRLVFIGFAAALVGYLTENEARRRSVALAVLDILTRVKSNVGLDENVISSLLAIRQLFGGRSALFVFKDTRTHRVYRWSTENAPSHGELAPEELPPGLRIDYLFAAPGAAWHGVRRRFRRGPRFDVVALDEHGRRIPAADLILPHGFITAHPCRRILEVTLPLGQEGTGRLFIIDPAIGIHRDANARFALQLANHLGRAMYSQYLIHHARLRAQASERGRIARELHDGITQSMLGIEMQIAAVRREAIAQAPQLDQELARIHQVLRNEVTSLRELTEGIKAGSDESLSFIEELAEMVERFQRHTGITASIVSEQPVAATMSPHLRREVARIVHEALVNVRKHSHAHRVLVRVSSSNRRWLISIDDDGRGFPFAGKRSQLEFKNLPHGPRMLGQRVRLVGGEMMIESKPGVGTRVEITIPLAP